MKRWFLDIIFLNESEVWRNLVPRAFSSFKMAVGETPGQDCKSGSKSSLEFGHANTMTCLCFVWITVSDCRKQTGLPDAGNNLRKSHFIMCHVTKYSTIRGVFQQPWPGVSPTAILNEEKALGTRLRYGVAQTKFSKLSHNALRYLYTFWDQAETKCTGGNWKTATEKT